MAVYINSLDKIKQKLKIDDNGQAQAFLTETCYKHMDKYVPQDLGNLRTIVDIKTHSITYESDYAEYQYRGQRKDGSHKVKHYSTAGTGSHWDRRMISAEKDDVIKEVQDFINHGGK